MPVIYVFNQVSCDLVVLVVQNVPLPCIPIQSRSNCDSTLNSHCKHCSLSSGPSLQQPAPLQSQLPFEKDPARSVTSRLQTFLQRQNPFVSGIDSLDVALNNVGKHVCDDFGKDQRRLQLSLLQRENKVDFLLGR